LSTIAIDAVLGEIYRGRLPVPAIDDVASGVKVNTAVPGAGAGVAVATGLGVGVGPDGREPPPPHAHSSIKNPVDTPRTSRKRKESTPVEDASAPYASARGVPWRTRRNDRLKQKEARS
jgi:hypothetical protein